MPGKTSCFPPVPPPSQPSFIEGVLELKTYLFYIMTTFLLIHCSKLDDCSSLLRTLDFSTRGPWQMTMILLSSSSTLPSLS